MDIIVRESLSNFLEKVLKEIIIGFYCWVDRTKCSAKRYQTQTSCNANYNMASKLAQFQPRKIAYVISTLIILWTHADDTMKSLICMSISFKWVSRN